MASGVLTDGPVEQQQVMIKISVDSCAATKLTEKHQKKALPILSLAHTGKVSPASHGSEALVFGMVVTLSTAHTCPGLTNFLHIHSRLHGHPTENFSVLQEILATLLGLRGYPISEKFSVCQNLSAGDLTLKSLCGWHSEAQGLGR